MNISSLVSDIDVEESMSSTTWDQVFDTLIDKRNCGRNDSPLQIVEKYEIAETLSKNIILTSSELGIDDSLSFQQILQAFPVLMISSKNQSAIINMGDFVHTLFAFDMFLHSRSEIGTTEVHEKDQLTLNKTTPKLPRGCQISFIKTFSSIIDTTAKFIGQHGYAAQHCRIETGYSYWVTIPQICYFLLKSESGLQRHRTSKSTVWRFLNAPNISFSASRRCIDFIDARVGTKKKHIQRISPRCTFFLFAQNKQKRKFAELHKKGIVMISSDMAKIKLQAQAVSRYGIMPFFGFVYSFIQTCWGLLPGICKQTLPFYKVLFRCFDIYSENIYFCE